MTGCTSKLDLEKLSSESNGGTVPRLWDLQIIIRSRTMAASNGSGQSIEIMGGFASEEGDARGSEGRFRKERGKRSCADQPSKALPVTPGKGIGCEIVGA